MPSRAEFRWVAGRGSSFDAMLGPMSQDVLALVRHADLPDTLIAAGKAVYNIKRADD